jgi:hypothetical protein
LLAVRVQALPPGAAAQDLEVPVALNTVTLHWDLTDLIQAGLSATLSITPTAQLSDTTDHVLIPPVARTYTFTGGTGQLAGIVANDNSAILPAGTGYLISVTAASGQVIVPQFQTQILFANGATQWLDALAVVPVVTTSYQYLPLPSGTPTSGQVPVATGAGEASAWTALTAASVGADASGAAAAAAAASLPVFSVKAYGATASAIILFDAAITATAAVLTSASAHFTVADVGKPVLVRGAGAAGASLRTTISGFTNSTTVTLTASASTTVTGATCYYGTDDSAAFAACAAAAVAAGGGITFVPPGSYIAAGIPLETGAYWQGAGFDASVIYLLPTGSASMFVAAASANVNSGSVRNLGLWGDGTPTSTLVNGANTGSSSTRACIDLSAASICQQMFVQDNYITGFGTGYYSSQNDRFVPMSGNRIWTCSNGIRLNSQHPNIGTNDVRFCTIGLWDGGVATVDLQCIGSKFNYNVTGVSVATAGDSRIIFSGCHFFGNLTYGAYVGTRTVFSGCLFDGNTGTQYMAYVTGNMCSFTGCLFGGGHTTAAIYILQGSGGIDGTVISGNTFYADAVSAGATGLIVVDNASAGWWYEPVINGNYAYLSVDQPFLSTTNSIVHPVITSNVCEYDNATPAATTVFSFTGVSGGGYVFSNNTVFGKNANAGPILNAGSSIRSILVGNRFRKTNATVFTFGGTDVDTRITDNFGYVTENSGTAVIASGTTSIAVTHGLARTPSIANIYAIAQASPGGDLWISGVGSTQFTINISSAPASNLSVSWYASAERG